MPSALLLTATLLLPQQPASPDTLPSLSPPTRILADGKPIEAITGHAAPFVVDCDGDGVRDLVVGMFGSDSEGVRGGSARIYKNVGNNKEPRFAAYTTLLSDGKPAVMESG
jgi:hypothetical protein